MVHIVASSSLHTVATPPHAPLTVGSHVQPVCRVQLSIVGRCAHGADVPRHVVPPQAQPDCMLHGVGIVMEPHVADVPVQCVGAQP